MKTVIYEDSQSVAKIGPLIFPYMKLRNQSFTNQSYFTEKNKETWNGL